MKQLPHLKFYSVPTAANGSPAHEGDAEAVRRSARAQGHAARRGYQISDGGGLRGLGSRAITSMSRRCSPTTADPANAARRRGREEAAGGSRISERVRHRAVCAERQAWIVAEAQAAAEQWKAIGVRVKLNVVPGTEYWETGPRCRSAATTWLHRPLGLMVLDLAYRTGVPWNETSYSNPEFDKLLNQADTTMDIAKRREVLGKLEEIMHEDGPVVQPLWLSTCSVLGTNWCWATRCTHPITCLGTRTLALAAALTAVTEYCFHLKSHLRARSGATRRRQNVANAKVDEIHLCPLRPDMLDVLICCLKTLVLSRHSIVVHGAQYHRVLPGRRGTQDARGPSRAEEQVRIFVARAAFE